MIQKATPNSVSEALAWYQQQNRAPRRSWENDCQEAFRTSYGMGPVFGTAYKQWLGVPKGLKVIGGNPDDAPVGSGLCYKGKGAAGHIMLAAYPFENGVAGAWSNDLLHVGHIDKVSRRAPITVWGHKYLGYILSVNGREIVPPKVTVKPHVRLDFILASQKHDSKGPQGAVLHPKQVKLVEKALAKEGLLAKKLSTDGSFGTATTAAYKDWQKRCGYRGRDADGKPGIASLRTLGVKYGFTVQG